MIIGSHEEESVQRKSQHAESNEKLDASGGQVKSCDHNVVCVSPNNSFLLLDILFYISKTQTAHL